MVSRRKPIARIWVFGRPRAANSRGARPTGPYRHAIAEAARSAVPKPLRSPRIAVEVYFGASRASRADVDNILKPIIDALKGIVYTDDRQVRVVKATVFPNDDAYRIPDWTSEDVMRRLTNTEHREFLIDVYEGLEIDGPPP